MRPVLFLGIDGVLCLNSTFTGYDAVRALDDDRRGAPLDPLAQLWRELLNAGAVRRLRGLDLQFRPIYVISSSWTEAFSPAELRRLFELCDLEFVTASLHEDWTIDKRLTSRSEQISLWLSEHPEHRRDWVLVDGRVSGTGLLSTFHGEKEFVVLCKDEIGLTAERARALASALAERSSSSSD